MVSFLRMCIMNNGLDQGSVISMQAVDRKQDYQLEWPYNEHLHAWGVLTMNTFMLGVSGAQTRIKH